MFGLLKKYLERFILLTSEDLDLLGELMEVRRYDKKVHLIEEGETEQYVHFVVTGLIRKFFFKGKEEVITQLAREGDLVNSSVSLLTGQPSYYTIETIESTTVLSISKENLERLYETDKKWERMGRLVMSELFMSRESWELDKIRYSTRERFVKFMAENPELLQRVPQKFLASYLNIKPETFSRLKHLLQKKAPRKARVDH